MIRKSRYNRYSRHIFTALALGLAVVNIWQDNVAGAPESASTTSAPATSPTARIIAVPQGFVRLAVADRTAICEPVDQTWVRDCLAHAPPGTQPSTRPSDLVANLRQKQDALQSNICTQLDFKDKGVARQFVNDTLVPLVDHLSHLQVKAIYLVITKPDLKRLVIAGWGSEQFYYNRIADKVVFNGIVDMSPDASDGESVLPVPYAASDPIDRRAASFREVIGRTEAGVSDMISRQAQSAVQMAFARFITESAIAPLYFKLDQNWFCAGVVGYLSSQFLAEINGANADDIVHAIARPDPENPVAVESIDLASPIPPDQLRPEIAGAYGDAFRRRSIAIVDAWMQTAGPDAMRKTFAAIHATMPVDGPALVQLIHKTTGVDLSGQLLPQ